MKQVIISTLLLLSATLLLSQEKKISLLTTPEGWRSELIPFPLGFAPELTYSGVEDIRFAKGWSDSSSNEFWAYAFIWYLDEDPQLNPAKLQEDLKIYFDGLMDAVSEGKEDAKNNLAVFVKSAESEFIGRVQIYDAFFTKKSKTLNMKVKTGYCKEVNKYTALFWVSPNDFDDVVWDKLAKVAPTFDCKK